MKKNFDILNSHLKKNKTLVSNFSYLSALQLFNIIIPLITYPYLTRVLGLTVYGLVAFAQATIPYFMVVINFGFNISATKFISINKNDRHLTSTAINSIYFIKILLFVASFLLLMLLVEVVPKLHENKLLYIVSFGICINEVLLPIWYFQGIERMKYITIINVFTRSIFITLIFLCVRNETDYLLVPAFNTVGAFVGGLISIFIVFKRHHYKFFIPAFGEIKFHYREALPIFASGAVRLIYMSTNKILIGSLINFQL